MVCSDNVCNRSRAKPEEVPAESPPTPAPSYREFAPPGYDTVMKKYKNRIFLINEPGFFIGPTTASMEPPPPASPTVSLNSPNSNRAPPPLISRVSVHENPPSSGLMELRVINNSNSSSQNNNNDNITTIEEREVISETGNSSSRVEDLQIFAISVDQSKEEKKVSDEVLDGVVEIVVVTNVDEMSLAKKSSSEGQYCPVNDVPVGDGSAATTTTV